MVSNYSFLQTPLFRKTLQSITYRISSIIYYRFQDIPQQKNGRDCGVFCLQFAEYLSRRQNFDFEQKHTAYFRKRMLYETLKKTLLIS